MLAGASLRQTGTEQNQSKIVDRTDRELDRLAEEIVLTAVVTATANAVIDQLSTDKKEELKR